MGFPLDVSEGAETPATESESEAAQRAAPPAVFIWEMRGAGRVGDTIEEGSGGNIVEPQSLVASFCNQ